MHIIGPIKLPTPAHFHLCAKRWPIIANNNLVVAVLEYFIYQLLIHNNLITDWEMFIHWLSCAYYDQCQRKFLSEEGLTGCIEYQVTGGLAVPPRHRSHFSFYVAQSSPKSTLRLNLKHFN